MEKTIFYERHIALKANMVDFNGWLMPLNYPTGISREHLLTRKEAGLFDISHMGRFIIKGSDACDFLQYTFTNNILAMKELESQYTILSDRNGYALDDAYIYRFFDSGYLIVVNAGNKEKDLEYLIGHSEKYNDVEVIDKTKDLAMIGLQGPLAKTILESIIDAGDLPDPIRNSLSIAEIQGSRILLARTGYTGEPICFELFMESCDALKVWDALIANKANPVGLGARDTLRLEANLPLYGNEFGIGKDGKNIPIFATEMSRIAVSFSHMKKKDSSGRAILKNSSRHIRKS